MNNNKKIITIIILSVTLIMIHAFPKAQYVGTDFISRLDVPLELFDWEGQDISYQVIASLDKHPDKFSNTALAYQYKNKEQRNLVFIILDAGNFHYPNGCFIGAGYDITDLQDTEFRINSRSLKAHTLLTEKNNEKSLSFYWIIIDKNIADKWINQKLKQLYFSLLNKERVGLMVRIDIPTGDVNIEETIQLAQKFINHLSQSLPSEQADYIFGAM